MATTDPSLSAPAASELAGRLPAPLGVALSGLVHAENESAADRFMRATRLCTLLLRWCTAVWLVDYASGQPDKHVVKQLQGPPAWLPHGERPSDGASLQLVWALARAGRRRRGGLLSTAHDWLTSRSEIGPKESNLQSFERLVQLRNERFHESSAVLDDVSDVIDEVARRVIRLLESADWLRRYRLMAVMHRSTLGASPRTEVQLADLHGATDFGRWYPAVVEPMVDKHDILLVGPDGTSSLRISPWMHYDGGRFWVFERVQQDGTLALGSTTAIGSRRELTRQLRDAEGRAVSVEQWFAGAPTGAAVARTLSGLPIEVVRRATPGDELAVGMILGNRFELLEQLGTGGAATVWRAADLVLRVGNVALKVLNPVAAMDLEFRERFIREAKVMVELRHPSILSDVQFHWLDRHGILQMPLLSGETLAGRIAPAGAPVDQVLSWAAQLLAALAHLAAMNVVHRDVKPSNLLVADGDRILLSDFGIAREEGSTLTEVGAHRRLGTRRYMAPEQDADSHSATPLADVYSAGKTLWDVWAGEPRRPSSELGSEAYEFLQLLRRMTDESPLNRPSAADALVEIQELMRQRASRSAGTTSISQSQTGAHAISESIRRRSRRRPGLDPSTDSE